jgi:hypothetical protein
MNKKLAATAVVGGIPLLGLAAYSLSLLQQDRITIANQIGTDSATVLLDGNRNGCVNDDVRRGHTALVGNFVPHGTCNAEIAVFARDNAAQFDSPFDPWTASANDSATVAMSPHGLLAVPVIVWTLSGAPTDATVHASRADTVYNTMQGGIAFQIDSRDVRGKSSITEAACGNLSTLKTAFKPIPQRLNVYYVERVKTTQMIGGVPYTFEVDGVWCDNDPDIVLIGDYHEETLAHELGHAFSLPDADPPLPVTNVMYGHPIHRDSLTTGQVYWVTVNTASALNRNIVRTGPTHPCADAVNGTPFCPALSFEVFPK